MIQIKRDTRDISLLSVSHALDFLFAPDIALMTSPIVSPPDSSTRTSSSSRLPGTPATTAAPIRSASTTTGGQSASQSCCFGFLSCRLLIKGTVTLAHLYPV